MKYKLSDYKIKNVKLPNKLVKLSDGGGLFVYVQPNGTKRFIMAYRFEGKQRTLTLGRYPEISLAEAREARDKAKLLLQQGIDPNAVKKEQKATASIDSSLTFFAQAELWFEFYKVNKAEITVQRSWRLLELYVLPHIGHKSVFDISRLELVKIIEHICRDEIYETARKTARLITMVLDNAVNRGVIEYSVAQRLASVIPAIKAQHYPFIKDPIELGIVLKAIANYTSTYASVYYALLLLPYVFVRNSELRCAQWDEINFDEAIWHIPAERMKMKKPHFVPLARQVVQILHDLKKKELSKTLLFPSPHNRSRPISDNAMRVALLRLGYDKEEISVHGFRSTASTLLHEKGFDTNVIESQLAHQDRNTIRATYNYAEYKDERITMMQAWADYLDGLKFG